MRESNANNLTLSLVANPTSHHFSTLHFKRSRLNPLPQHICACCDIFWKSRLQRESDAHMRNTERVEITPAFLDLKSSQVRNDNPIFTHMFSGPGIQTFKLPEIGLYCLTKMEVTTPINYDGIRCIDFAIYDRTVSI